MASRRPLKPAFEVQFLGPQPLAAGAMGGAPRSERGGSRFEAWAASQFFAGIVQRTGRNATNVQIGVRLLIPVPGFSARSSNRTGHSAPNAEIGVGIPTGRPFRGVGRLVRHLIVDQDDAGSIPVHRAKFFRGRRLTAGSLVLSQRMRVQFSPALPWGCRLNGKDRWLSISGCGIVTRHPYQVSGYKLWRRSTRLLIERAQFESVMAHQVILG